jgi:hypothetical protein
VEGGITTFPDGHTVESGDTDVVGHGGGAPHEGLALGPGNAVVIDVGAVVVPVVMDLEFMFGAGIDRDDGPVTGVENPDAGVSPPSP